MSLVAAFSEAMRALHHDWDGAVEDLSPDQLAWRPDDKGNNIAFTTWHVVRTVDNVVRFVLQDRRATAWLEGGWDQKFGLDRVAQGTGWPPEQAAAFRLPDVPAWMEYQRAVWKACEEYLSDASDADLEKTVTIRPFGEMPARRALMTTCITHCFTHLGEVYHIRGLMGLKTQGV